MTCVLCIVPTTKCIYILRDGSDTDLFINCGCELGASSLMYGIQMEGQTQIVPQPPRARQALGIGPQKRAIYTKCGFMFYRDTSYCIVLQQCTASCYSVPYVSSTLYRPSKSFANVSYIIIQFYYDRPIKYCYFLRVGNNNNKLITFCPS